MQKEWLLGRASSPLSLLHQCRLSLRKFMASDTSLATQVFDLPLTLQLYINYDYWAPTYVLLYTLLAMHNDVFWRNVLVNITLNSRKKLLECDCPRRTLIFNEKREGNEFYRLSVTLNICLSSRRMSVAMVRTCNTTSCRSL